MKNKTKPKGSRARGKRIIRRLITTLVVLLILAGAGIYVLDSLRSAAAVTYNSYTASTGSISNSLAFSGSLQLINSQTCTAQTAATVRTVYVTEGQQVKKGDKLIRLSRGDVFTADFDGTVNQVYVEKGDDVSSGTQLVQVADFTHMKVSVRVDEYDISSVSVGMPCVVTCTSTEKTFSSSIASINYISASAGNVAYYTTTAYVDVDDGVYPGMQVTITVPQEEANDVVVLKEDALSFDARNNAYVLIKQEDGTYAQQSVEVGVSNGNYVQIKTGLKSGDTVYVAAKAKSTSDSILSSLFSTTQVNQPTQRGSWGGSSGSFPSGGSSGSFPSGGSSGSFPGGGSSGSSPSGGSRSPGQP